jgi:acyl carrier protein
LEEWNLTERDRLYQDVGEIIGDEIGSGPVSVLPGMALADIRGWDSVALIGVLLAIEQRLGNEPDRDSIDRIRSVDDLVAILAGEALGPSPVD